MDEDEGYRIAWEVMSEEEREMGIQYYMLVYEGAKKLGKDLII